MNDRPIIVIISLKEDFHAQAVDAYLSEVHDVEVNHIYSNEIIEDQRLYWCSQTCQLYLNEIPLDNASVIWTRRVFSDQLSSTNSAIGHFNNLQCTGLINGALRNMHHAKQVNYIDNSMRSENKLVQLKLARELGFTIPATIVTKSALTAANFFKIHKNVVIKKLQDSRRLVLETVKIDNINDLYNDEQWKVPIFLQQCIEGNTHLRVNIFGESCYTFKITCAEVDWRPPSHNAKFDTYILDPIIEKMLKDFCKKVGLKMAIFDLMITYDGKIVFLECNQQGQFLFLQDETKIDLLSVFSEFLYSEAIKNLQI